MLLKSDRKNVLNLAVDSEDFLELVLSQFDLFLILGFCVELDNFHVFGGHSTKNLHFGGLLKKFAMGSLLGYFSLLDNSFLVEVDLLDSVIHLFIDKFFILLGLLHPFFNSCLALQVSLIGIMDVQHLEDVCIGCRKYFFPAFLLQSYHDTSLSFFQVLHRGVFSQRKSLSFSEVELRNFIGKSQAIVANLKCQRVVMGLDISSANIEVALDKQTFPHVNISIFSEFLPIAETGIIVSVGDKELFVLGFEFLEGVIGGVIGIFKRNVDS